MWKVTREALSIKMSVDQSLKGSKEQAIGYLREWGWGGRECSKAEGIVDTNSLRHDYAWQV